MYELRPFSILRLDLALAHLTHPGLSTPDNQGKAKLSSLSPSPGYHTVHIGKWHLGTGPEFGRNAQGFDESLMQWCGLYLPVDNARVVNSKQDFDAVDEFLWVVMQYAVNFDDGPPFEPGGYITDQWTDEAIEVIRANRNGPLPLSLAHWAPHTPLQALRSDYEAVGELEPQRPVAHLDLTPTLARAAGAALPEGVAIFWQSDCYLAMRQAESGSRCRWRRVCVLAEPAS
ncbi:MAG: sulfatase-like hydrolase/transferase [Pseudomonadales bacterium]|nr:sulfatase-like hydrolase/transferase [Pseudomonadales bacterium]